jgi:hypothetical protein
MQLTGFEMVIMSIMGILLTVLGAMFKMTRNLISKTECEQMRKHCGDLHAANVVASSQRVQYIQTSIDNLKNSNDIQYGMLRAIVIHMPGLSDSERERILNINRKE